jgi:GNAT superfamily N-acetyltransferase
MIEELPREKFSSVERFFAGREQNIPALGVLAGRFPGKAYVDEVESPRIAMVWALSRWAYIAGDSPHVGFLSALQRFLEAEVFQLSLRMHMRWFELYAPPSPDWESAVETSLADVGLEKHYEGTFVLDQNSRVVRRAPRVPEGLQLQRKEFPLVPESSVVRTLVPAELVDQTTFGFQLVSGSRVLSICRSTGLSAGRKFMVEVETCDESERGKGHATVVSTALVNYALGRGLIPLWETTADNEPSRRLARRLGFVERETYPVYAMRCEGGRVGRPR